MGNSSSCIKSALLVSFWLAFVSPVAMSEGADQCPNNRGWCQCGGPGSSVSQSVCLKNSASCNEACGYVGPSEVSESSGMTREGAVLSGALLGLLIGSFAGPPGMATGVVIGAVAGFAISGIK